MHSDVYHLNREWGVPGKKYICALDQSKERLLLRAEVGRDFLEDMALRLSLKAEAGWVCGAGEGSIARGGACYTPRCGRGKT